jgi:prepilin-type N-terminal cleavage/methylation domain-containing protein
MIAERFACFFKIPQAMTTQASAPRLVTTRSGFTLTELLTVIAIIGILAAILIPVAGKVRSSASKAACTNNLRQLVTASLSFAVDHKHQLPTRDIHNHRDTWRHPHVYHQDDFKLFRPYISLVEANREATSLLFCPGPLKQVISAESSGYNGDTALFISYSYYNLRNLNGSIFTGYNTDEKSIRRKDLIPTRFPLWGCLTTIVSGNTYLGHDQPRVQDAGLAGQNVARADGSVEWIKGDSLIPFVTEGANVYHGPRP